MLEGDVNRQFDIAAISREQQSYLKKELRAEGLSVGRHDDQGVIGGYEV